MIAIGVFPDGALIDRVAEVAYHTRDRARTLFASDPAGYTHAVAILIQTLASAGKVVVGKKGGNTTPTMILRQRLAKAGCLEYSDYFDAPRKKKKERSLAADKWLNWRWDDICEILKNPRAEPAGAMMGHLKREVYYWWLHQDTAWKGDWYRSKQSRKNLPPSVLERFTREVEEVAVREGVAVPREKLKCWIEQCVTTHFHIFGEYWCCYESGSDDEYMPALTRSSILRGLYKESDHLEVRRLVMPFVGLAALKKMKQREDLIERAIEWSDGDGREVVDGLRRLQEVVRSVSREDERVRLMEEAKRLLNSIWPRSVNVGLNLVRHLGAQWGGKHVEIDAAERALKFSLSRSYRWLWRIREPELQSEWRRRVDSLLI